MSHVNVWDIEDSWERSSSYLMHDNHVLTWKKSKSFSPDEIVLASFPSPPPFLLCFHNYPFCSIQCKPQNHRPSKLESPDICQSSWFYSGFGGSLTREHLFLAKPPGGTQCPKQRGRVVSVKAGGVCGARPKVLPDGGPFPPRVGDPQCLWGPWPSAPQVAVVTRRLESVTACVAHSQGECCFVPVLCQLHVYWTWCKNLFLTARCHQQAGKQLPFTSTLSFHMWGNRASRWTR